MRAQRASIAKLCQLQRSLAAHDAELTRLHLAQGLEHDWRERRQKGKARPRRPEHEDAEATARQILLEAQILIRGDEGREPRRFTRIQQWSVIEIAPPPLLRRLDQMPG